MLFSCKFEGPLFLPLLLPTHTLTVTPHPLFLHAYPGPAVYEIRDTGILGGGGGGGEGVCISSLMSCYACLGKVLFHARI